jgi:hypothetical protein
MMLCCCSQSLAAKSPRTGGAVAATSKYEVANDAFVSDQRGRQAMILKEQVCVLIVFLLVFFLLL